MALPVSILLDGKYLSMYVVLGLTEATELSHEKVVCVGNVMLV